MLQWQALMAELKPMSDALYNSPPFGALRDDPFAPITLGRYARIGCLYRVVTLGGRFVVLLPGVSSRSSSGSLEANFVAFL